ncbi:hypothetical protein NBRC116493_27700 [Aurantivibrio infirmus]
MNLNFSNCSQSYEQLIFWLLVISTLLIFVSLGGVIRNEKLPSGGKGLFLEIAWPVVALVTSKYLNSRGAKWRAVLLLTTVVAISCFVLAKFLNICVA